MKILTILRRHATGGRSPSSTIILSERRERFLHNQAQPACRLPYELYAQIFSYDCAEAGRSIAVSHVCRYFRAVALSTPSLWTHVTIKWPQEPIPQLKRHPSLQWLRSNSVECNDFRPGMKVAMAHLDRSGTAPLVVHLDLHLASTTVDGPDSEYIAEVTSSRLDRCRDLCVDANVTQFADIIKLFGNFNPMPHLRSVEVNITAILKERVFARVEFLLPKFIEIGSLTSLKVHTPPNLPIQGLEDIKPLSLRHIDISCQSTSAALCQVLSNCAETLETCQWESFDDFDPTWCTSMDSVTFPRLQKAFFGSNWSSPSIALQWLNAPLLTELHVKDGSSLVFEVLSNASFPSLRSIMFSSCWFNVENILQFLHHHTCIEHLSLSDGFQVHRIVDMIDPTETRYGIDHALSFGENLAHLSLVFPLMDVGYPEHLINTAASLHSLLISAPQLFVTLKHKSEETVPEEYLALAEGFPNSFRLQQL